MVYTVYYTSTASIYIPCRLYWNSLI